VPPEIQRRRGLKQFASGAVSETAPEKFPTFVEDTAAKTGLPQRTIREDIQIAKNLAPDVADKRALTVELAESDENLIRNELTILERAEHLARRKEIYEALYPQARPEIQRRRGIVNLKPFASGAVSETAPEKFPTFVEDTAALKQFASRAVSETAREKFPTFVEDTAAKTGLPQRTIRLWCGNRFRTRGVSNFCGSSPDPTVPVANPNSVAR